MLGLSIFLSILGGASMMVSVLLCLYGIFGLIFGRMPNLKGKYARISSLYLIGQSPIAFLLFAFFFTLLDWGKGVPQKAFESNMGASIIFVTIPIMGYIAWKYYSKTARDQLLSLANQREHQDREKAINNMVEEKVKDDLPDWE